MTAGGGISAVPGAQRAHGCWRHIDAQSGGLRFRHLARQGSGAPLLLVHGIGPGTTGQANFAPLLAALPSHVPVHMIDLFGFGGSQRKPAQPGFDVALWLEQITTALEQIGRPALLVGNSVGGALALKAAARGSDLVGVLAIGSPAASCGATAELRAFWRAPADIDQLARALIPMTGDQRQPAQPLVSERFAAFVDPDYAHWFNESLSDPDACLASVALSETEAAQIRAPVRILHGTLDRACPPAPVVDLVMSQRLGADLTLLNGCGHNVLAERTDVVVEAINQLCVGISNT